MSLQDKVLNVLKSGRNFTPAQLAGLLKTTEGSIGARVAELREQGYAIYNNTTKNGKSAYRLGAPSRRMVAAAYAMQGSSIFSR